jgi:hypothetical protein
MKEQVKMLAHRTVPISDDRCLNELNERILTQS